MRSRSGLALSTAGRPAARQRTTSGHAPAPDQRAPLELPLFRKLGEHDRQRFEPRLDRAPEPSPEAEAYLLVDLRHGRFRHRRRVSRRAVVSADAPLQQPGVGQLLQGSAPLRAPRDRVRDARGGRRRSLEPRRADRGLEPGAASADAGARRRPPARGVERDPVVLRRGNALRPGRSVRPGARPPVAVLRAVRARAVDRGGAVPEDVLGPAGALRGAARGAARARHESAGGAGAGPGRP